MMVGVAAAVGGSKARRPQMWSITLAKPLTVLQRRIHDDESAASHSKSWRRQTRCDDWRIAHEEEQCCVEASTIIDGRTKKVAKAEGVAVNQLINVAAAEKVSALRTEEYFAERAAKATSRRRFECSSVQ
jgi:hypothetical protein